MSALPTSAASPSPSPPPQSISTMKLMQFQGMKHAASSPISLPPVQRLDLTPSPEVPLMIMKRKLMATNDLQESRRLVEAIHRHLEVSPGTGAAPALRARSAPPDRDPGLLEPGARAVGSRLLLPSVWERTLAFVSV